MVKEIRLEDFRNLHYASHLLSTENKKTLGLLMPIRVYVQDPYVEQDQGVPINDFWVSRELDLADGPTSARFAVVDYDVDRKQLTEPAKLVWDEENRVHKFVKPDDQPVSDDLSSHQFHQVSVWATVQRILALFEESWVLGRPVPWAFEGNRLIVMPHAGCRPNAYYDRSSKSLQFYYFGSPEEPVYTCLSHDIVAHETGHAILDGLRPYFLEDSSIQTTAFHEFAADLTAIISAILDSDLRAILAEKYETDLSKDEILSAIAEQFGHYAENRPHLRSAQEKPTMREVKDNANPYDWSLVLTGAMFAILTRMARARTGKPDRRGRVPTPRQTLTRAAASFRRTALQPLDFLPPVDVQFIDYARAVLYADRLYNPGDLDAKKESQEIIAKAFAKCGLEDLEDNDVSRRLNLYPYDINRISRSPTDAYHFLHENRRQLCIPHQQDFAVVGLYRTDKRTEWGLETLPQEIVIQYVWREAVELKGRRFGRFRGQKVSLLCGGTLVFDGRGNLLYWVRKPGTGQQETDGRRLRAHCKAEQERGEERRDQLLDYVASRIKRGLVGLAGEEEAEGVVTQPPVVVAREVEGTLRLQVTPHLRHWKED
jgi:hypothetical protein